MPNPNVAALIEALLKGGVKGEEVQSPYAPPFEMLIAGSPEQRDAVVDPSLLQEYWQNNYAAEEDKRANKLFNTSDNPMLTRKVRPGAQQRITARKKDIRLK